MNFNSWRFWRNITSIIVAFIIQVVVRAVFNADFAEGMLTFATTYLVIRVAFDEVMLENLAIDHTDERGDV